MLAVKAGTYSDALDYARQAQCLDQSNHQTKMLVDLLQQKMEMGAFVDACFFVQIKVQIKVL